MSETKAALHMAIIEIAPPDPDAVKARLDVQAKSWARPDALEHREPVEEVEIAYDALNCIHYLQGELTSLRAQLDEARRVLKVALHALKNVDGPFLAHEGEQGIFLAQEHDCTCWDAEQEVRALLSESKT